LVLQTSSKYASNLEQWKLPGWMVSFSCDSTWTVRLLGRGISWFGNIFIGHSEYEQSWKIIL